MEKKSEVFLCQKVFVCIRQIFLRISYTSLLINLFRGGFHERLRSPPAMKRTLSSGKTAPFSCDFCERARPDSLAKVAKDPWSGDAPKAEAARAAGYFQRRSP